MQMAFQTRFLGKGLCQNPSECLRLQLGKGIVFWWITLKVVFEAGNPNGRDSRGSFTFAEGQTSKKSLANVGKVSINQDVMTFLSLAAGSIRGPW
jgi:hypothetical protein